MANTTRIKDLSSVTTPSDSDVIAVDGANGTKGIGNIFLNTDLLPVMWDYSNLPLNYKGIICVPFMLLWIVLSFLAIIVADSINYYVFDEKPAPYYKLFGRTIIQFKEK